MKVMAESTDRVVEFSGVPARIWEATTEGGVPCFLFVTRVAVAEGQNTAVFERELAEQKPPTVEAAAFPLRMVL